MPRVKGRNLIAVEYEPIDGILVCRFSKSGEYRYKGVPENVYLTLLRVPYADRYFTLKVKGQYPVIKPEKKEAELPLLDQPKKESTMEIFLAKDGLTFKSEGHKYTLNGQRLMSLTQILDAAGLVDYSMVQPDVLANKAQFGTRVHEYCLWADQAELDMDDLKPYSNYFNRVSGWLQFLEDFDFIPNMAWCEVPAAVKVNGMTFAMTVDRFGIMGSGVSGIPAIVEIKTCADREPSHQIQTAAQAIAFKGDGSVPLKRYAVYLLDKPNAANRLYFAQEHTDRLDEKVFMAALITTQYRLNNGLLKG
jgi:hypothetical protein